MKGKRTDRLNSEFRKNIYDVIKYRVNVSGITEMFTITEVDTSPDIKNAKVYISVYSTSKEKADATFNAIKGAAQEIRHELASVMRNMRYIPELRFYRDEACEYGSKIDGILSNITYGEYDDDNGDSEQN